MLSSKGHGDLDLWPNDAIVSLSNLFIITITQTKFQGVCLKQPVAIRQRWFVFKYPNPGWKPVLDTNLRLKLPTVSHKEEHGRSRAQTRDHSISERSVVYNTATITTRPQRRLIEIFVFKKYKTQQSSKESTSTHTTAVLSAYNLVELWRLKMIYKTMYGLVTIPLPLHLERSARLFSYAPTVF